MASDPSLIFSLPVVKDFGDGLTITRLVVTYHILYSNPRVAQGSTIIRATDVPVEWREDWPLPPLRQVGEATRCRLSTGFGASGSIH